MSVKPGNHLITTIEQLSALYGTVGSASVSKEVDFIHPYYRAMIEAAPFALLSTHGATGPDISPRGDQAGFVIVADEHTLLLPDRRGNNRIDSLRNIVADPKVALLFLIPGVGETLRVYGAAHITTEPALLERCIAQGKLPTCVLVIKVERVFFQCARAVQRAALWRSIDPAAERGVPTAGAMLAALTNDAINGDEYDRALPARQHATLY